MKLTQKIFLQNFGLMNAIFLTKTNSIASISSFLFLLSYSMLLLPALFSSWFGLFNSLFSLSEVSSLSDDSFSIAWFSVGNSYSLGYCSWNSDFSYANSWAASSILFSFCSFLNYYSYYFSSYSINSFIAFSYFSYSIAFSIASSNAFSTASSTAFSIAFSTASSKAFSYSIAFSIAFSNSFCYCSFSFWIYSYLSYSYLGWEFSYSWCCGGLWLCSCSWFGWIGFLGGFVEEGWDF